MRSKISMMMLAATASVGLGATSAMADYTFSAFNPSPSHFTTTWQNFDLLSLGTPTAGLYGSFSVLVDWTGGGINDQWSNEARVFFKGSAGTGSSSTPTGAGTNYTTSAFSPTNGASTGNDVTNLSFTGTFGTNYNGGDPLFLNFRQTFSGANSNWSNVRITLNTYVPPAPPSVFTDLGTLAPSGMVMGQNPYTSNTVQWYKFTLGAAIPSGELFQAHTAGNTLTGGQFGSEDTEIALFDPAGNVIASSDDTGSFRWSNILIGGGLAAGDYYIAASAYNLAASNGWVASVVDSGGPVSGDIKLTITPAPSSAALLGLGGLVATRRRRR